MKQTKIKIGSIVRLKQGKGNFLGIVKGIRIFGDETIPSDCTIIMNVFWMHDPSLKIRPLANEIDVLS